MRSYDLDVDIADFDADGLSANVDSSGTTISLNGALISGGVFTSSDGLGRIIIIHDSNTATQSDVTFTINGTDTNDDAISNTITGPASGATVPSTKYFKTVSSITVSAAQGGTEKVDVGTLNTTLSAVSPAVVLNHYNPVAPELSVDVTGTISFTVQETFDDILSVKDNGGGILWTAISALATKTADTTAQCSIGAKAVRLVVNSYTNSAEAQMQIITSNYG